jgi:hypothetical protein
MYITIFTPNLNCQNADRGTPRQCIRRGCYARAISSIIELYGNSTSTVKGGPQKRAGCNTGTGTPTGAVARRGQTGGGKGGGCYRKRAAAVAVAVTESGRSLKAAVTGSGPRPRWRPLLHT